MNPTPGLSGQGCLSPLPRAQLAGQDAPLSGPPLGLESSPSRWLATLAGPTCCPPLQSPRAG